MTHKPKIPLLEVEMQSGRIASLPICCYSQNPKHRQLSHCHRRHLHQHLHFFLKPKIKSCFAINCILTLTATNKYNHIINHEGKRHLLPHSKRAILELDNNTINQTSGTNGPFDQEEETEERRTKNSDLISTNMWWADLRAAVGQRFNLEGTISSATVVVKDRHLALPHVSVPDVRYIDWGELQRKGFRGVVFDKDNTITAPYSLTLWGPIASSVERCKSVFGNDIAVFSNSAGLYEYDPDGSKARALEKAIGIKVIRHKVKKPAGTAEEIEEHFGCSSSLLILVGDRIFTDIVYGNRNGFLTILTKPLSLAGEPFIVKQLRNLEASLVNRWYKTGSKRATHSLLPDAQQCVKDPPSL